MSRRGIFIMVMFFLIEAVVYAQTFHTAVAKPPQPGTIFIYPERIKLKYGGLFNSERGIMFVPLNRAIKNSDVIAIEIYRFRRTEKANPQTPPIFYLHGGPSFEGLEKSLDHLGTFEERWLPLLDVSDVVVVSQRGIGPSKPTTIIETTTKLTPPDEPYDDKKAVEEFQQVLAREKRIWERLGLDLSGFTVVEAAADINDVRKALGYEKIIIWGGSFGSHWGMAVMRYYPEIVERAILRGMEGPNHTYDHPGHLWNVYKKVAEEAEKAPELKGFIPECGLIKAIEKVVERVEKNPFRITIIDPETNRPQPILFDGESIRRLVRGYSGGLETWPADVITLYNGDFSKAAKALLRQYHNHRRRRFRTASFFMLDCGSGITAKRLAEYNSDPAVKLLNRMNWTYIAGCPVWGSDLGDAFRQNFETNIPAVIVQGTWDTSTPFENALELVPYFKNSRFIPVIRGPHSAIRAAMRASEQFKRAIMKFAATGEMSELPEKVEMPPVKWVIPDIAKGREKS